MILSLSDSAPHLLTLPPELSPIHATRGLKITGHKMSAYYADRRSRKRPVAHHSRHGRETEGIGQRRDEGRDKEQLFRR